MNLEREDTEDVKPNINELLSNQAQSISDLSSRQLFDRSQPLAGNLLNPSHALTSTYQTSNVPSVSIKQSQTPLDPSSNWCQLSNPVATIGPNRFPHSNLLQTNLNCNQLSGVRLNVPRCPQSCPPSTFVRPPTHLRPHFVSQDVKSTNAAESFKNFRSNVQATNSNTDSSIFSGNSLDLALSNNVIHNSANISNSICGTPSVVDPQRTTLLNSTNLARQTLSSGVRGGKYPYIRNTFCNTNVPPPNLGMSSASFRQLSSVSDPGKRLTQNEASLSNNFPKDLPSIDLNRAPPPMNMSTAPSVSNMTSNHQPHPGVRNITNVPPLFNIGSSSGGSLSANISLSQAPPVMNISTNSASNQQTAPFVFNISYPPPSIENVNLRKLNETHLGSQSSCQYNSNSSSALTSNQIRLSCPSAEPSLGSNKYMPNCSMPPPNFGQPSAPSLLTNLPGSRLGGSFSESTPVTLSSKRDETEAGSVFENRSATSQAATNVPFLGGSAANLFSADKFPASSSQSIGNSGSVANSSTSHSDLGHRITVELPNVKAHIRDDSKTLPGPSGSANSGPLLNTSEMTRNFYNLGQQQGCSTTLPPTNVAPTNPFSIDPNCTSKKSFLLQPDFSKPPPNFNVAPPLQQQPSTHPGFSTPLPKFNSLINLNLPPTSIHVNVPPTSININVPPTAINLNVPPPSFLYPPPNVIKSETSSSCSVPVAGRSNIVDEVQLLDKETRNFRTKIEIGSDSGSKSSRDREESNSRDRSRRSSKNEESNRDKHYDKTSGERSGTDHRKNSSSSRKRSCSREKSGYESNKRMRSRSPSLSSRDKYRSSSYRSRSSRSPSISRKNRSSYRSRKSRSSSPNRDKYRSRSSRSPSSDRDKHQRSYRSRRSRSSSPNRDDNYRSSYRSRRSRSPSTRDKYESSSSRCSSLSKDKYRSSQSSLTRTEPSLERSTSRCETRSLGTSGSVLSRVDRERSQMSDSGGGADALDSNETLNKWRLNYCSNETEMADNFKMLANMDADSIIEAERKIWSRSAPADLYYTLNESNLTYESTNRVEALCDRFRNIIGYFNEIKKSKPKFDYTINRKKFENRCKHCGPNEDSSDEDSSSDDGSHDHDVDDIEESWMKELELKQKHPDRLHPELWFNDKGEMNDGPLCRCSNKSRRSGIRHNIYQGENVLQHCVKNSNNSHKLYHYRITVSPPTNFLINKPTIIKYDGHEYIFEGFSLFSHYPLKQLPTCKIIRFNIQYTIVYIEEKMPNSFSVQETDLFFKYLFHEILELVDLDLYAGQFNNDGTQTGKSRSECSNVRTNEDRREKNVEENGSCGGANKGNSTGNSSAAGRVQKTKTDFREEIVDRKEDLTRDNVRTSGKMTGLRNETNEKCTGNVNQTDTYSNGPRNVRTSEKMSGFTDATNEKCTGGNVNQIDTYSNGSRNEDSSQKNSKDSSGFNSNGNSRVQKDKTDFREGIVNRKGDLMSDNVRTSGKMTSFRDDDTNEKCTGNRNEIDARNERMDMNFGKTVPKVEIDVDRSESLGSTRTEKVHAFDPNRKTFSGDELDDRVGCPQFHLMPRFVRELEENGKELLPMCKIIEYFIQSFVPVITEDLVEDKNNLSTYEWQDFVDEIKGMVVTKPGSKPSSIRVDQLDRESENNDSFPDIIHFGIRPPQLSYAGNPQYQKLWKDYVKLRHLIANKPKKSDKDKKKLFDKESKLQQIRNSSKMKRGVTVAISSRNFYRTGIMCDMVQHAMLIPVFLCHLRFHQSLNVLEDRIQYKFKNRYYLQLALTHPSYRENFGTNPDHARNSLTNCGIRQPEYGDRRIHFQNTRKRGINTLINIMSKLGRKFATESNITHNERLEFLGDAVVEFVTSIHLFHAFPHIEEGGLATFRAAVVQNQNLASLAKKIGLEEFMLYAHGSDLCHELELRHAMANCYESLMGALFLDGGIDVADDVFSRVMLGDQPQEYNQWILLPKHPLQQQEAEDDRLWVDKSPVLDLLQNFERLTGITFKHIRLLARVFTTRSLGFTNLTLGSNQRLEFLGDTVLQLITSDYLYNHFPEHHEGHLSLLRSSLVNNRTQSVVCDDIGMPAFAYAINPKLDLKMKDRADLLEALLGAMYIDRGMSACKKFCSVCFFPRLQYFILNQEWNDPKSKLQQCCLTLRTLDGGEPDIPIYKVVECIGPTNSRIYTVAVYFQSIRLARATGNSIQSAEMNAAKQALDNSESIFPQLQHQKRVIAKTLQHQV